MRVIFNRFIERYIAVPLRDNPILPKQYHYQYSKPNFRTR